VRVDEQVATTVDDEVGAVVEWKTPNRSDQRGVGGR
jgi:hypothetical protein